MIGCAILLAEAAKANPLEAVLEAAWRPLIPFFVLALVIKLLIELMPTQRRSAPPRRKSREERKFDLAVRRISLFALGIGLIVFSFKCSTLKLGLWCAAIGLMLIVAMLLVWNAKAIKGKIGELVVRSQLRCCLPPGEYHFLDDVYLPIGELGTTQIDHIVVSRFGVFVVETKNFTGWIFANRYWAEWRQVIYHDSSFSRTR